MKPSVLCPVLVMVASACGSPQIVDREVQPHQRARLAAESSGIIGCPQGEIVVQNVSGERARYILWEAVCRGQLFQCSKVSASPTRCAAPPAGAPASAASPTP